MPLYNQINTTDFNIALWRIEEDNAYFEPHFVAHPDIKNENKKLQWFASRHLVNTMLGTPTDIEKDEAGKPVLKTGAQNLSLSHTPIFAAAMLSPKNPVGIDLEMVNPKVERIAHKFLRDDEIDAIHPDEKLEKLILYWSAKEALYKLYGKGEITFATQLLIQPFHLKLAGELNAAIVGIESPLENLTVHYQFFEDHVLTYVCHH
ncbi:MAG TPA: 4'-phosphopantetheinyl transferase superfamily protein [Chitinophagales bacterium]|nr:4'-phosphopantetheinyl transferase superfamily protein [Chitinophagales bacterium]